MNGFGIRLAAGAATLLALGASALPAHAQSDEAYPSIRFSGRVGVDYTTETVESGGAKFSDEVAELSSVRLGAQGDLSPRMSFMVVTNLAEGDINWLEVALTTRLFGQTDLVIGQTRTPSLGNMTSSRATSFIDRGLYTSALGLGRQSLIMLRTSGERWALAAAAIDDNVNTPSRGEYGYALRTSAAPILSDSQVLHLGVWMRERDRNSSFNYAFRDTFDSGVERSGEAFRTQSDTTVAVEAAWVRGPLTVQSEIAHVEGETATGEARAMRAAYVSATWIVTGGSREYDVALGRFGAPERLEAMPDGGRSVIDVGVRYDRIDLSRLAGGGYSAWMFGANWYATPKVKLAATYAVLEDYDPATDGHVDLDRLQLRATYDF